MVSSSLVIENSGPLNGKVKVNFDKPVIVLTGNTGTGKSFVLRLLSVLTELLASEHPDPSTIEDELGKEFGAPSSIVSEESDQGRIVLSIEAMS